MNSNNKQLIGLGIFLLTVTTGMLLLNNSTASNTALNASTTTTIQASPALPATAISNASSAAPAIDVLTVSPKADQVIKLYDQVNEFTAEQVVNQIKKLQKNGKPIYLLLNSPGGSVLDGALILSAMEASKVPVNTVCVQLCASMAAIIHQYGANRYMVNRSILMFHPAAGGLNGSMDQMKSRLSVIDRYVNKMDAYIAKRVGVPYDKFMDSVVRELWIDAEDSLQFHFADKIVNVIEEENKNPVTILPVNSKQAYETFFAIEAK